MFDSRLVGVLVVFLTVAVAGCMDSEEGVEFEQTSGVDIQSLQVAPSELNEGQEAIVSVQLINSGEEEASIRDVSLTRIPVGTGAANWGKRGEFSFSNPRPGDASTGVKAVSVEDTVTIIPPEVENTINPTVGLSVEYDYTTVGSTTITVMDQDRFVDENPSRENPGLDNSAGPVQMEVRASSPVAASSGEEEVCVVVKNKGSGEVVGEKVDLSVESTGGAQLSGSATLDLVNGEASKCFRMTGISADSSLDVEVFFTADYTYRTSSGTSVTVRSR